MPCWSSRWLFLVLIMMAFPSSSTGLNRIAAKFHDLLGAIDRVVSYSIAHHKEMNFDGVFGLWIVKGYLNHLLSNKALWQDFRGNSLLNSTKASLTRIKNTVEEAIPEIIQSVKKRDPPYFQKMSLLLNLRWFPQPPNELIGASYSIRRSSQKSAFDEQISDKCVSQLLLSNHSKRRCQPSDDCFQILIGNPSHGYALTHQVLYAILLLELDCTSVIMDRLERLGYTLFSLTTSLCTNTLQELLSMLNSTYLNPEKRDLFMEQIFVCSHLGYLRFNHLQLLDMILSWQHPSGCFSDRPEPEPMQIVGRKLLEEHRLSDGCLSHTTSVATAALFSFLRRFLITSTDGGNPEGDLHQILILKEAMSRNSFIPKLLEPPKSDQSLINRPWTPSVPDETFEQLSRFHWISPWHAAGQSSSSAAVDTFSIIDVDKGTRIVFYCFSFFSLVLCLVFCLRIRRWFHAAKFGRS